MNNKKILIWLGMILSILIVFLIVYIINSNNSAVKLSPTPPATIQKKQQSTIKAKEQHLAELEKLKREMKGITNETFVIEASVDDSEFCSNNEDAERYQKEIVTGQALIVEGTIAEIGTSHLKINFKQGPLNWVSIVNVNQETLIATINQNSEQNKVLLTTFKVGEKVIVQSTENVTNANFIARSILKFVQN